MFFDRVSYRRLQWLPFCCLLLHNAEEGWTFALHREKSEDLFRAFMPARMAAHFPSVAQFRLTLVCATVLPLALTFLATRGLATALKNYVVAMLAVILLVNVLLPHVPAAIALGGYSPGLVTAVFLNLPACASFFGRSLREGRISRRGLAGQFLVAIAALALGLPLLWSSLL